MSLRVHHSVHTLAATLLAATLSAQSPTWIRKDVRGDGGGPNAGAFDAARERLVMFWDGTWEWDGVAWTRRISATEPPPRGGAMLAYDAARRVVVMFGGGFLQPFGDTWEWDGVDWVNRTAATSPPAGGGYGMTYDPVRQRTLLVTYTSATWEWDGATWTQRAPASSPPPRGGFALAWDEGRQRAVLFGGSDAFQTVFFADTWEWDGNNWSAGPAGPSGRTFCGMAYDSQRGRIVLQGGMAGPFQATSETWEYDGLQWTLQPGAQQPPAVWAPLLAYDRARQEMVMFRGQRSSLGFFAETWVRRCANGCSGTTWTRRLDETSPLGVFGAGLAFDRARGHFVLFGGSDVNTEYDETWTWNGLRWSLQTPAVHPSARVYPAMSFDAARGETVMFGGTTLGAFDAETWTWSNGQWAQRTPAVAPPARTAAAMVYDDARAETVLFGGIGSNARLDDTWIWDGTTWAQRTPPQSPPARGIHAMAFDAVRSRTVLFGGAGIGLGRSDTWEWDGAAWLQRIAATTPPGRIAHAMAFDPATSRVLMFGGEDGSGIATYGDTWAWNGVDWQAITMAPQPQARSDAAMATDTGRGQVMLFGGFDWGLLAPLDPMWLFTGRPAATATAYGSPCPPGSPTLAAYGVPTPSCERFGIDVTGAGVNAVGIVGVAVTPASVPVLGCTLHIGPPIGYLLVATNGDGFGAVTTGVPSDPVLLGAALYAQGFALDPTASSGGVRFSNGLRLLVGE
ncbi:MAG: hypothetical protein KDE27_11230 [Planctomycetes bacterium]|nr:hypothetical protein [Planctomycetota bacterium]